MWVATGFTFSMKSMWSWVGTGHQIDYGLSGMGHDGSRNDELAASTKDNDRSDVMKRGNESRFGVDSGVNYVDGRWKFHHKNLTKNLGDDCEAIGNLDNGVDRSGNLKGFLERVDQFDDWKFVRGEIDG